MKTKYLLVMASLVFLVSLSGCKDIMETHRPGSFGNTPEEVEMVQALSRVHGDLFASGDPRFLELIMTSRTVNFVPVDVVSKYSKDSEYFIAWFVYDNFDNDEIEIEWKYLETNYIIHTFFSRTGKNFGRGEFILEKPDEGWPLGYYRVTVRGRGVEESIDFEVIDGRTESVLVDFSIKDTIKDAVKDADKDTSQEAGGSSINFLTYSDINFPISFDYPFNYELYESGGNIFFQPETNDGSYYFFSVLTDESQGGYASAEHIKQDYFSQLTNYGPVLSSQRISKRNNREFNEFSISYFHTENYRNDFIIAKSGGYFYVLQFVTPIRLNKNEMIEHVKNSILIEGNDELRGASGANSYASNGESSSTSAAGVRYNAIHESLIGLSDQYIKSFTENGVLIPGGNVDEIFVKENTDILGYYSDHITTTGITINTSSSFEESIEWVNKELRNLRWGNIEGDETFPGIYILSARDEDLRSLSLNVRKKSEDYSVVILHWTTPLILEPGVVVPPFSRDYE